jgi:hypothetical protein
LGRYGLLAAAAIGVEAGLLGYWAATGGVNQDEGFYIRAGWYVTQGQRLYRDVFYPQMPYLPWLEGLLFSALGVSLFVARGLSVVCGALAAGLLTWFVGKREESVPAALLTLVFYALNTELTRGLSTARTYGLSSLGLLVGLVALLGGTPGRLGWVLVAGLATALAIGVRLPLAPVAFVLLVLAWRKHGRAGSLTFSAALLAGSLPWLFVALSDWDRFWFCNVEFHALRREMNDLGSILGQKIQVVEKWVLLPQHLVAWSLVIWASWRAWHRAWPAVTTVVVVGVGYLMATPTYLHYMTQLFPLVLLAAAPVFPSLAKRPVLLSAALALYVAGCYPLFRSPDPGTATAAKRELWSLATVTQVTEFVRSRTQPADQVLSWWEGYPVLSHRPGLVGVGFWESNAAKKLSPDVAHRYHLLRKEDVQSIIQQRLPAAIVDAGSWDRFRADIVLGYEPARRFGAIEVFLRRGS